MSASFEDRLACDGKNGGLDKEAGGHRAPAFTSEVSHIFVASLENSGALQHACNN